MLLRFLCRGIDGLGFFGDGVFLLAAEMLRSTEPPKDMSGGRLYVVSSGLMSKFCRTKKDTQSKFKLVLIWSIYTRAKNGNENWEKREKKENEEN